MNSDLYLNLRETPSTPDPNLHRVLIVGGGALDSESDALAWRRSIPFASRFLEGWITKLQSYLIFWKG